MNRFKLLIFALAFFGLFLVNFSAQALPKKYSNCQVKDQITNPTNAQGVYLSRDCKIAYVLPPQAGEIKIIGQSFADGGLSCAVVDSYDDDLDRVANSIQQIDLELEKLAKENSEVRALRKNCDIYFQKSQKFYQKAKTYESVLSNHAKDIQRLKNDKQACQDPTVDSTLINCDFVDLDMDGALFEYRSAQGDYKEYEARFLKYDGQRQACDDSVTRLKQRILDDQPELELRRSKAINERLKIIQNYEKSLQKMMNRPGLQLGINFYSKQTEMVNKYIEANQNLAERVQFTHMPISSGLIAFEMINNGTEAGEPAIFKSNINGIKASQGGQETVQALRDEEMVSTENIFGQAAGGNVTFNEYATCKIIKKIKGMGEKQALNTIAGLVKPTVVFKYQLQVDRRIKVSYNERHMYQRIKTHTKKKQGLFSTKSVNSMIENAEAEKWLSIEMLSEDADNAFVDPIKMALDIRREYIDAALIKVAKGYISPEKLSMLDPGESAAQGGAKVIRKECPYAYCQYAAAVLDLGNALFGGSETSTNYRYDASAKEEQVINESSMVKSFGTSAFEMSVKD